MRAETLPLGVPAPLLRVLGWSLSVMLIAAALLPVVPRLLPPPPALTVEVSGELRRLGPDAVRRALAPYLAAGFHDLDLPAMKAAVEALPWAAQARVERAWPDTVRVHLREHRPYARWGAAALLAEDGAVFTPEADEIPPGLPPLAGPPGREREVRAAFDGLRTALAGTPFVPASLTLDERGGWTARTPDGIELRLGRGSPLDKGPLLAGPVTKALAERLQEVSYVDLHYIHGFAVGWRDGVSVRAGPEPDRALGRED